MLNTIISKQHAILGNSCTCTFDLSVVRIASIIRGLIIYKELSPWAGEQELSIGQWETGNQGAWEKEPSLFVDLLWAALWFSHNLNTKVYTKDSVLQNDGQF